MKADNSLRKDLVESEELEIYEEGLKSFKNMSVSGGTAITLISYPVSQASKIAGHLERNSKNKNSKFNTEEIYPSVYDWELVRGENFDSKHTETCRPYVIKYDEKAEEKFNKFTETVNELYKIKNVENLDNKKDSKTSTVNKFREFMNDENQAKLTAYRNNSKSDGILYDAIEIWGLNCKFDNEIEQNKDENGEA